MHGLADRVLEVAADCDWYQDLRARGIVRAVELAWPEVGRRQADFYSRALQRREGLPLRPDRAAAEREFGAPAQVVGGGRPFALPVLREDTPVSRALALGVDAMPRLRR